MTIETILTIGSALGAIVSFVTIVIGPTES